tara:strand:- start:202 stop:597 length:396 start_codon:yes stop_codon:yes gene_type:complete
MKITKKELANIIKEEVEKALATEEQLPQFDIFKVLEVIQDSGLNVQKMRELSQKACKNKGMIKAAINAGQFTTIIKLFGPEEIEKLGQAILGKGTVAEIEEWLKTPEGKGVAIQGLEMACQMSNLGGMFGL